MVALAQTQQRQRADGKVTSFIPESYQTPNAFVDQILYLLEPNEWVILSYVCRHILGWQDNLVSRTAVVSVTMIEKGYTTPKGRRYFGCGLSRPTICSVLDRLALFGILERVGEPTPDGQEWRVPEDDSSVDYDGLHKRVEDRFAKNRKRTEKGARRSAEKRIAKKDAGKSDLPDGPVNPIYQERYVPFTDAGKSGLRNSIHDQIHTDPELNTLADRAKALPPATEPLSKIKSLPDGTEVTGDPNFNLLDNMLATVEQQQSLPPSKKIAEPMKSQQEEPSPVPGGSPLPDCPGLLWYTVAGDNHLVHLAKPTPSGKFIKPICGHDGHYAVPAAKQPIGGRQPCMECQRKAAEPKATGRKPWSDLTDAKHNAIPQNIRPPGRPHYGKENGHAEALFAEGFTPERIAEYVTWAYINDRWICCGGEGGAPIVITMSYVKDKIKAWQTTKGANGNGQFTTGTTDAAATEQSGIRQGGGGSGGAYSPAGGGGEASRAPVPSIIPAAPGIPRPASLPGVQRDRLDKP